MAKRKRKMSVMESPVKPKTDRENGAAQFVERQRAFNNRGVEHRIAAIQAIYAVETENLLSRLHLLHSYLSKEQLETSAITFFQENFPNLSVIRNEKYKVFELQWNDKDTYLPANQVDGRKMGASLDSVCGLQFSVNSVRENFLETANLQIPDFILNEPSEDQMPGTRDAFQTPGATVNQLSFGMTPKTSRLPKHGEMLMSVHDSPLGVYKEHNLAAIHGLREANDVNYHISDLIIFKVLKTLSKDSSKLSILPIVDPGCYTTREHAMVKHHPVVWPSRTSLNAVNCSF